MRNAFLLTIANTICYCFHGFIHFHCFPSVGGQNCYFFFECEIFMQYERAQYELDNIKIQFHYFYLNISTFLWWFFFLTFSFYILLYDDGTAENNRAAESWEKSSTIIYISQFSRRREKCNVDSCKHFWGTINHSYKLSLRIFFRFYRKTFSIRFLFRIPLCHIWGESPPRKMYV